MNISSAELETFRTLPAIIMNYIAEIPEAALDTKRNAHAWTIRKHIYHIAGVQKMLFKRMETIKAEENPVIEPYFPENDACTSIKYCSIGDAFSEYSGFREKQIQLIGELPREVLTRQAHHKEYFAYSIPVMIKHMIFHEYWHMYRIEEIWLVRDEYFH